MLFLKTMKTGSALRGLNQRLLQQRIVIRLPVQKYLSKRYKLKEKLEFKTAIGLQTPCSVVNITEWSKAYCIEQFELDTILIVVVEKKILENLYSSYSNTSSFHPPFLSPLLPRFLHFPYTNAFIFLNTSVCICSKGLQRVFSMQI